MAFDEDWVPRTRLGKLVVEGQVASMEEAIKFRPAYKGTPDN